MRISQRNEDFARELAVIAAETLVRKRPSLLPRQESLQEAALLLLRKLIREHGLNESGDAIDPSIADRIGELVADKILLAFDQTPRVIASAFEDYYRSERPGSKLPTLSQITPSQEADWKKRARKAAEKLAKILAEGEAKGMAVGRFSGVIPSAPPPPDPYGLHDLFAPFRYDGCTSLQEALGVFVAALGLRWPSSEPLGVSRTDKEAAALVQTLHKLGFPTEAICIMFEVIEGRSIE